MTTERDWLYSSHVENGRMISAVQPRFELREHLRRYWITTRTLRPNRDSQNQYRSSNWTV